MATPELREDVQKLRANISNLSNGEARIIDCDGLEKKVPRLKVELFMKDGYHKGGTFVFQVFASNYPHDQTKVVFLTRILHPAVDDDNIEVFPGCKDNGTLLEATVKDVIDQIKNPKFDSVLSPLFYDDLSEDDQVALSIKFAKDAQMSLRVDEILERMNAQGKISQTKN